jgi:hypothetical protein
MARSVISGPSLVVGNLNPTQLQDGDVGPSLFFQGEGLVDPRLTSTIDAAPGRLVAGFYNSASISILDVVPTASAAGNLHSFAASTVVPVGGNTTPATLNAATQSIAVSTNLPLDVFPPGPLDSVVSVPATLDFGFTTATGTAGASTLTIPAGAYRFFKKGQAIAIAGAGASSSQPLLTQVASTPASTTLTITGTLGTSITSQPVGTAEPDLVGQPQFASTTGVWPIIQAGCVALWDPTQLLARCLRVVSNNAGDTGYSVTVRGWDVYGVPMTETISVSANATAYGKKAWKYVNTVQLNKSGGGTTAGTITVGTGDVFGLGLRSDLFEYLSLYWAGTFQTANTGWLAADTTNPALATSGDIRGTIQLGTLGGGTGYTTSPNGSLRLAVFMSIPAYNAVNANNLNYASFLGYGQNAS